MSDEAGRESLLQSAGEMHRWREEAVYLPLTGSRDLDLVYALPIATWIVNAEGKALCFCHFLCRQTSPNLQRPSSTLSHLRTSLSTHS